MGQIDEFGTRRAMLQGSGQPKNRKVGSTFLQGFGGRMSGAGLEDVDPGIWKQALAKAKEVEDKYGVGNLGPYDDFDWGMLNGKLSALRWLIGFDWDMLDT